MANEPVATEMLRQFSPLDGLKRDNLAALARKDEAIEMLVAAESKDPESPLLRDVRERVFPELE